MTPDQAKLILEAHNITDLLDNPGEFESNAGGTFDEAMEAWIKERALSPEHRRGLI